jgi:hypothetical protein
LCAIILCRGIPEQFLGEWHAIRHQPALEFSSRNAPLSFALAARTRLFFEPHLAEHPANPLSANLGRIQANFLVFRQFLGYDSNIGCRKNHFSIPLTPY